MYIFVIQLLAPYLHQSEIFLKIYKVAHHIFLQFIWKNMEVTSIRVELHLVTLCNFEY